MDSRCRNRLIGLLCVLALLFASQTGSAAEPVAKEVTFKGAGDLEMHGTLLLPSELVEGKRFPAVLLIPGSGPTDRDGNQKPAFMTDLLKQIAERLAIDGIATLRFDKRAVAIYKDSWPKDVDAMSEFFSYENFIADAKAAYRFLTEQTAIDPARVAIAGHSEGGLFALQIGADLVTDKHPPATLVLMSTAGRTLDVVIYEQVSNNLKVAKVDLETTAQYLEYTDRAIEAVKKGEKLPTGAPTGLAALFNPSALKLMHAYFTVDPLELAAKCKGPVLIVQGEKDVQISAKRDEPVLEKALRGRDAGKGSDLCEVLVVPVASHNLKAVVDEKKDTGFAGPVIPAVLDKLSVWLGEQLLKTKN